MLLMQAAISEGRAGISTEPRRIPSRSRYRDTVSLKGGPRAFPARGRGDMTRDDTTLREKSPILPLYEYQRDN